MANVAEPSAFVDIFLLNWRVDFKSFKTGQSGDSVVRKQDRKFGNDDDLSYFSALGSNGAARAAQYSKLGSVKFSKLIRAGTEAALGGSGTTIFYATCFFWSKGFV